MTAPNWQLRTDNDAPEAGLLLTISIAPVAEDCDVGPGPGGGASDARRSLVSDALGPVGEMVAASPQAETKVSETIADTAAAEKRLIVRSHATAGRTSSPEPGWRRC